MMIYMNSFATYFGMNFWWVYRHRCRLHFGTRLASCFMFFRDSCLYYCLNVSSIYFGARLNQKVSASTTLFTTFSRLVFDPFLRSICYCILVAPLFHVGACFGSMLVASFWLNVDRFEHLFGSFINIVTLGTRSCKALAANRNIHSPKELSIPGPRAEPCRR